MKYRNQTDCVNKWVGLFCEKPSKEIVLAALQHELEQLKQISHSVGVCRANRYTKMIDAMKLWNGTSQNIYYAGVWIANVKWINATPFYESEE